MTKSSSTITSRQAATIPAPTTAIVQPPRAAQKLRVLVVGQTPPPMNGQSLMIQELLNGRYRGLELHHVRLNFSRSTDEIGAFQVRKLFVLFETLADILVGRFRSRAQVLYFPPAGPTLNPVVRDIFLLLTTRVFFRHIVFHFHAAGLSEIYPRLPFWLKPLFRLAYRRADLAIAATQSTVQGITALTPRRIKVVPYGIPDHAREYPRDPRSHNNRTPRILFMGILCEGKGVLTLIEACALLQLLGVRFRLSCAGAFLSEEFKREAESLISKYHLQDAIDFPGVLSGAQKWKALEDADLFCLPSHYHAESFGVVLIEAMSFSLPIVTTRWRGIPDVVEGSGGTFLVEPKRPDLISEKLKELLNDPKLRYEMGQKNRSWFCGRYTLQKYRAGMEQALESVAPS